MLSADLLRRPRGVWPARLLHGLVLGIDRGVRGRVHEHLQAAGQPRGRRAVPPQVLPYGTKVLVEPSQNIPPIGSYFYATNFYRDYVVWGPTRSASIGCDCYGFDTYRYLYDRRPRDEKRDYIASRLAQVDWIVMDDTYVQWYEHLPEADYAVVKQHYRDLFAGRLGFELERTFKVYPSLFGYEINDDGSEFSFRLFDHPASSSSSAARLRCRIDPPYVAARCSRPGTRPG